MKFMTHVYLQLYAPAAVHLVHVVSRVTATAFQRVGPVLCVTNAIVAGKIWLQTAHKVAVYIRSVERCL